MASAGQDSLEFEPETPPSATAAPPETTPATTDSAPAAADDGSAAESLGDSLIQLDESAPTAASTKPADNASGGTPPNRSPTASIELDSGAGGSSATRRVDDEFDSLVQAEPVPVQTGPIHYDAGPITRSTSIAELVVDAKGFTSTVMGLAFSPDARLLAAAGDKVVRVWDLKTGELVATLRGERNRSFYGNCYGVAFSPDGKSLLVGIDDYSDDGSLRVYEVGRWSRLSEVLAGQRTPIRRLAFSDDGRHLASAGDNGGVCLWSWRGRKLRTTIEPPAEHAGVPLYLDFPLEDDVLLMGRTNGPALFSVPGGKPIDWRAAPAALKSWYRRLGDLKFPEGGIPVLAAFALQKQSWIASGRSPATDKDAVRHWVAAFRDDRATPGLVYRQHRNAISAIALDRSGRLAASADYDGEVHLWETRTGKTVQKFTGIGQPIYGVAWSSDGARLAFSTTPSDGPIDRLTGRGTFDHSILLSSRFVSPEVPAELTAEALADDVGQLSSRRDDKDERYRLVDQRRDGTRHEFRVRPGALPTCAAAASEQFLNIKRPLVFGDDGNVLLAVDAERDEVRRDFTGHSAAITGVSISPDRRYLASSSIDGTIRIWSLEDYQAFGEFDFRYLSDRVIEVPKGTSAAAAGVKVGDRIVTLDGYSITELETMLLTGTFPYRAGQRITLVMERAGQPREVELTLREGAQIVEPLLTFFFNRDLGWVAWTQQGYFDASPGAEQAIGWHVNRGPGQSSRFIPVKQLREALYRPDLLDRVLKEGKATFDAPDVKLPDLPGDEPAEQLQREVIAFDVRRPETLAALEPPRVLLTEPTANERLKQGRLQVKGVVRSQSGRPIRDATLLLNGRPVKTISPPNALTELTIDEIIDVIPGNSVVGLVARNAFATSEPHEVAIRYETSQPVRKNLPNLVILAVGVSRYADQSLNLQFAASDADRFLEAAAQQTGTLYNSVITERITNEAATRDGLRQGLTWLSEHARPQDIAVLYISSHGFRNASNAGDYEYYLGTHEVDPEKPDATGLPASEIVQQLRTPAKVVLFLDTCHSKGFTEVADGMRRKAVSDLHQEDRGFIVFASSLADQVSLESGQWKSGAFTKALIDTLHMPRGEGLTEDGVLTLVEVAALVAYGVQSLTENRQNIDFHKPASMNDFRMFSLLQ